MIGTETLPACTPTDPAFIYIALALSVFVIGGMIAIAVTMTRSAGPVDRLITAVIVAFCGMAGVWVVDNVLFVNRSLLEENESTSLLNIISGVITLAVGYYFGREAKRSE